jgi:hypothetical protein
MDFLTSPALLITLFAETDIDGWRQFSRTYEPTMSYPACRNSRCRGRHVLCTPSRVTLGCINCLRDNKFCSLINTWFAQCIQTRLGWCAHQARKFLGLYNQRKSSLYQQLDSNPYLMTSPNMISREFPIIHYNT